MMILLSCYIENYGKLSKKNIDFQKDLTVFCEENGYGKTTLVSFLKAMFYGLPSYKTSSKGFPERQHFYPFNGGKFGGSLEFEHGGKQYRVERFFDKKSDTKDECRIFCDTLETQDFGKNGELLGRSIFKLDEDSFVRTVFAEDLTAEISMTTDLFVALNRLVDDTDDDRNFENAIKDLNELRKKLHTDRGNHGLIPEQKEAIKDLEARIGRFKNLHQKELETRYEEKHKARNASEQASLLLKQAIEQSYWEMYDAKQKQIAEKKKELEELRAEHPSGIPTKEERARLLELLKEHGENLSIARQAPNEEKEKRLTDLSCFFEAKIPSDDEILAVSEKITECERLKTEIVTLQNGANAENSSHFILRFQRKTPSEADLANIRETARLYRENQALLQNRNYQVQEKPKEKGKAAFFCGGGAFFLLLAFVCFFFSHPLAIVAVLIGSSSFALALFDHLRHKKETVCARNAKEEEWLLLQKKGEDLKKILLQELSAFDYPLENDPNLLYERFCHELESYRSFVERQKNFEKSIAEKRALLAEIQKAQQTFFMDYSLEFLADDRQKTDLLRDNLNEYRRILAERTSAQEEKKKADLRMKEILDLIHQIYRSYGIPFEDQTLKSDFVFTLSGEAERMSVLKKNLAELEEDAQRHRDIYHLETRPTVLLEESLDFYRDNDRAAQTRENEIDSRIRELEFELEELPELENELVRARETLSRYEQDHRKIALTVQFLQKAEQSLLDRYIAPVRDSFCKYASMLEGVLGENIRMDKEYRISFLHGGELHSDKHLSTGQYALSALCMRLALAEQIYGDELPFLVLDDPFVHLDENHLEKALQTVVALSEKTQILYFTCHRVRAPFTK